MDEKMRKALLIFAVLFLTSCAGLGRYVVSPSEKHVPSGTSQLVSVSPTRPGRPAVMTVWERSTKGWRRVFGPWPAAVGRNGFAPAGEKIEGDGRTPTGLFDLGVAFGREENLKTGLAYRQLTPDDFWIDDIASPRYNHWAQGIPHDATSYETMLRPDGLYDLGAVIRYNMDPVVSGQGSAIFLHIWHNGGRKPTAGCVALDRERLRTLLGWLDANKHPAVWLDPKH